MHKKMILMTGLLVCAELASANPVIVNQAVNTWYKVPSSAMMSVKANTTFGDAIFGTSGPSCVLSYSGAVLDTRRNRLVLWGGGHAAYNGNEIYAFDINTLQWSRLTDPTASPGNDHDALWDGNPSSRHTYNGMAYIAHADCMMEAGGAPYGQGNAVCKKTWTFDFATLKWKDMQPSGTMPNTCYEDNAAYDPVTKKVFWGNDWNSTGIFTYDYDHNSWAKLNSESTLDYRTSTIDTKRGLLIIVGQGQVLAFNIRTATPAKQVWATTGGASIVSVSRPGIDYDPVSDRIVGFNNTDTIYALNPDTKAWTIYSPVGAGPSKGDGLPDGMYGRFRYVPSENAFIAVSSASDAVYFYKMTAGTGVEQKALPKGAQAMTVSPNPCAGKAAITLSKPADISITDVSGRQVARFTGKRTAAIWNAQASPAGVYFVRAEMQGLKIQKKVIRL